jgi:hypothetical protein
MNLPDRFSRNPQISNLMKIHPVGAELFQAQTHTDTQSERERERNAHITNLIVDFLNFVNPPKKLIK